MKRKCKHNWRLFDNKFGRGVDFYVVYCTKCLILSTPKIKFEFEDVTE